MTSRTLSVLLASGIAAGVLMPALLWADGATRSGYSLWHHGASQLGTGERAWLQTINFVLGGLLLAAFSAGIAYRLDTQGIWRPAPAGLLEHLSLLAGFCWLIAVGVHLRRTHSDSAAASAMSPGDQPRH